MHQTLVRGTVTHAHQGNTLFELPVCAPVIDEPQAGGVATTFSLKSVRFRVRHDLTAFPLLQLTSCDRGFIATSASNLVHAVDVYVIVSGPGHCEGRTRCVVFFFTLAPPTCSLPKRALRIKYTGTLSSSSQLLNSKSLNQLVSKKYFDRRWCQELLSQREQ